MSIQVKMEIYSETSIDMHSQHIHLIFFPSPPLSSSPFVVDCGFISTDRRVQCVWPHKYSTEYPNSIADKQTMDEDKVSENMRGEKKYTAFTFRSNVRHYIHQYFVAAHLNNIHLL